MKRNYPIALLALLAMTLLAACSDSESYSDLLNSERNASNAYLSTQRVVNEIPKDTIFEVGSDAPFYRLDSEGNVYMQVLKAGDRANDRARTSQDIYFRFTRYNLINWYSTGELTVASSNAIDMGSKATYFKYADYSLTISSQWGYGLQMPLAYLGVECEVNLLIKSQYGPTDEIADVQPYLYHVRYFHSQI